MTDSWAETVDRLNAANPSAHETAPTPVEAHPGAESWQPYASPPVETAAQPDPLILEVEQSHAPTLEPALVRPMEAQPEPVLHPPGAASVYGHVDTPLPEPPAASITEPASLVEPPAAPVAESVPHMQTPEAEPVLELSEPLEPPPATGLPVAASVAQMVKPVESAPEPAEPVAVLAPASSLAPVVAAYATPQPTRPTVTQTPAHSAHDAIDPVLAGFDHVVALAGYVLLFISVFMFGVPALATMALAYAHKNDSHLLVRSHYRFQLRIFWTAILFALLAIGSAVTAGGLAITKLVDFARAHLPGVGAAMDRAGSGAWSAEIAGVLLIAAVTLAALAVIWTLVASLFGFLRLLGNRPIGHQYATK